MMTLMKMMILMKKLLMKRNKVLMKGAIAQLGERYTGSVEVSGSNPLSSTNYFKTGILKNDDGSFF